MLRNKYSRVITPSIGIIIPFHTFQCWNYIGINGFSLLFYTEEHYFHCSKPKKIQRNFNAECAANICISEEKIFHSDITINDKADKFVNLQVCRVCVVSRWQFICLIPSQSLFAWPYYQHKWVITPNAIDEEISP